MASGSSSTGFVELVGLGLRRLRTDPTVTVVLGVVTLLTAFGISAAPRYLNTRSDNALAEASADASPAQRRLTFDQLGGTESPGSDDPFGQVEERGVELASDLEGRLGDSISGANYVVTSPLFELWDTPVDTTRPPDRFFRFRFQNQIEDQVGLVEGRLPAPANPVNVIVADCDEGAPRPEDGPDPCAGVDVELYETALTAETAEWLRLGVGDRILLYPRPIGLESSRRDGLEGIELRLAVEVNDAGDFDTPLDRTIELGQLKNVLVLEVSGIVELTPATDEVWQGDSRLHRPSVQPGVLEGFSIFAMGLLSPDDYPRLIGAAEPFRFVYQWRFPVDFSLLNSENIEEVVDEINAAALIHDARQGIEDPRMGTGIPEIAGQLQAERDLAVSFSSLVLIGLGGMVLAVSVVLAALAARRQEQATILIRGRGASSVRLGLARLVEGLVLFVPISLIGMALAGVLVGGRPGSTNLLWALAVAFLFAVVLVVMSIPTFAGDLGQLLSGGPGPVHHLRRIVIETVLIVLAIGSGLLLRRRGIDPETSSGFDPLLAATPLLITLGAGAVLLRVTPYAARFGSRLGNQARGVVAFIGLRSILRRSLAAQLPAVVILFGVAFAVFGVVLEETVTVSQFDGSYHTVGANYRIEPAERDGQISPQLSLEDTPEIEATADAALLGAQVDNLGMVRGNLQLLALDLAEYQRLGKDTPADPMFPASMLEDRSLINIGTRSNPIPALVSTAWPTAPPQKGDIVSLTTERKSVIVVVEETRDDFPGLDVGRPFVVLSRSQAGAIESNIDVKPNRRYVKAPDSISDEFGEVLAAQQRGVRLVSRPDLLDGITESPAVSTVEQINRIALIVSGGLAVVAALAGFALTSRERNRDLGYLRAVGMSQRQMTLVGFTEQLPPAFTATAFGLIVGIGISYLIGSALDLSPLTGTQLGVTSQISWSSVLIVASVILGMVVLATAIYSYLNREMNLADVLRRGDRV